MGARQSVSVRMASRLRRSPGETAAVPPACFGAWRTRMVDVRDRDRGYGRGGHRAGRGGVRDSHRDAHDRSWAALVRRGRHRSAKASADGRMVEAPVPAAGAGNRTAMACGTGPPGVPAMPKLPLRHHHTSPGCLRRTRRLGHCHSPRRRCRWRGHCRCHRRCRCPQPRTRPAYRAARMTAASWPLRPDQLLPRRPGAAAGCAGARGGGGPTTRATHHGVGARSPPPSTAQARSTRALGTPPVQPRPRCRPGAR